MFVMRFMNCTRYYTFQSFNFIFYYISHEGLFAKKGVNVIRRMYLKQNTVICNYRCALFTGASYTSEYRAMCIQKCFLINET